MLLGAVGGVNRSYRETAAETKPGHCKALAPEYEAAATTLTEKNIPLAKVDCTEQADLCQEFGVEGYPTLKVFRGTQNVNPYTGARKADAYVLPNVDQWLSTKLTQATVSSHI